MYLKHGLFDFHLKTKTKQQGKKNTRKKQQLKNEQKN